MNKIEETIDEKGLDNHFRFCMKKTTPDFERETHNPEDDPEEPIIPDGYHIVTTPAPLSHDWGLRVRQHHD